LLTVFFARRVFQIHPLSNTYCHCAFLPLTYRSVQRSCFFLVLWLWRPPSLASLLIMHCIIVNNGRQPPCALCVHYFNTHIKNRGVESTRCPDGGNICARVTLKWRRHIFRFNWSFACAWRQASRRNLKGKHAEIAMTQQPRERARGGRLPPTRCEHRALGIRDDK